MRIAIVEDEAPIARRLERAVRAYLGEGVASLAILPTLAAAVEHVRSQPLDLVFLDLNVGGRDGYRLLAEAAASRFRTIVVSAHEDQAIRAFELGVTDFVPKPWSEARLQLAIDRATGSAAAPSERALRLSVRTGGGIELVELERVVAIRGADDYSELMLVDGETRLHERSLTDLERVLPDGFMRVHRSWIVRLDRVRGWEPRPGGRAVLTLDGTSVPVGRTYRRAVLERLREGSEARASREHA